MVSTHLKVHRYRSLAYMTELEYELPKNHIECYQLFENNHMPLKHYLWHTLTRYAPACLVTVRPGIARLDPALYVKKEIYASYLLLQPLLHLHHWDVCTNWLNAG